MRLAALGARVTPSTKACTRLSSAYVRDRGLRPIVITVQGSLVTVRAKGLRQAETMDIAAIYSFALKSRLAREKAERKASRKAKR